MLVLHLISIAPHPARDKPITIKFLLLLVCFELEWDTLLSIREASIDILIIDMLVKSGCLALAEARQIIGWVIEGNFSFSEEEPMILRTFSN
jgi:hypothetical protein